MASPLSLVRTHPVGSFSALALALSWIVWIPAFSLLPGEAAILAVVVGSFGPAVAGGLVTWLVGDDVRAWAGTILRWRRRPRYYLVALLLPPALGALAVPALLATGGSLSPVDLPTPLAIVAGYVAVLLVGGGNEEPGWRGFALPRLQATHGPLAATGAIGAVWALWHAPLYLFPGGIYHGDSFALFTATVFAFSVLFTWLHNTVGGSVLLCMVMHASVNTIGGLAPSLVDGAALPPMVALGAAYWVGAGIVLAVAGRRLGYEPAPGETGTEDASFLGTGP